ncbi:MAG: Clp protease N-terminal domain-containing protein [Solirubrobacteraceae bacterium]|jgi:ATP-dependent Clp protease ATP-binding subunit ClpA
MEAPDIAIGWFTDQAYNAILLAEDEARMLGQPRVEPEHLLLAAARRGNVEQLLAREGVTAGAIHAAVVRMGGFGAQLVLGPVPRSTASETVLQQAIAAATKRGIHGPSTEHLLLGLAEQGDAMVVLRELGLGDVTALVDAKYPVTRGPLDPDAVERRERTVAARKPPAPGPIPPVFERFSREAHRAVEAAVESARSLENQYVAPAHLLLGLLGGEKGVVASVRPRHQRQFDAATARAAELMADHSRAAGQMAQDVADRRARVSTAPTGIFSAPARHLVAEDVLSVAHRLDHRIVGTGHLFLAILENPDETTAEILEALPDAQQIAGEMTEALPGDEHT